MKSMLLASFMETYGLWIILIALLAVMFAFNFVRGKKATEQATALEEKIVAGAKVKTYSGFYGTVEKITETTDGKVITLQISENAFVDVDIRAIMAIDEKRTMAEVEEMERLEQQNSQTENLNEEQPEQEAEVVETKEEN